MSAQSGRGVHSADLVERAMGHEEQLYGEGMGVGGEHCERGESEWKKEWGQGKKDRGGGMKGAVQLIQAAVGNLEFSPFLSCSAPAKHLSLP